MTRYRTIVADPVTDVDIARAALSVVEAGEVGRGPQGGRMTLAVVPLTLPKANAIIERLHRHHGPLPGGFAWWAVGAVDEDGNIVGVALAGRPTNRNNDDGQTVEVQRVATDGSRNACSLLYGACARAAKAIGAARIITYTLDEESGASLRAVGWIREADGITSWWTHNGSRTPARDRPHMQQTKVRWACHFREPVALKEWGEQEFGANRREAQGGGTQEMLHLAPIHGLSLGAVPDHREEG